MKWWHPEVRRDCSLHIGLVRSGVVGSNDFAILGKELFSSAISRKLNRYRHSGSLVMSQRALNSFVRIERWQQVNTTEEACKKPHTATLNFPGLETIARFSTFNRALTTASTQRLGLMAASFTHCPHPPGRPLFWPAHTSPSRQACCGCHAARHGGIACQKTGS